MDSSSLLPPASGLPPPAFAAIHIQGARTHNLKNVTIDIPRDRLVVITGPSGSGKTSLAFDTLFAEGQRQYIETLSSYARQFVDQLERPDVDLIEGLQPTIAIDQRRGAANPRSTVATVTEIHDYLRLLYARVGEVHCYRCGLPIGRQTADEIVAWIMTLPEGTKLMLLAPAVRGRKGRHSEVFQAMRKAGLVRARVDGTIHDLDSLSELAPRKAHTIEAVVDRLVIRPGIQGRLTDSLDLTLEHGSGLAAVMFQRPGEPAERWTVRPFSTEHACPQCGISYEEIEPRTFSFNSPHGACPACQGLGVVAALEPEPTIPPRTPRLSPRRSTVHPSTSSGLRGPRSTLPCPECKGARLRPEARSVRLGGHGIHELAALSVEAAQAFFASWVPPTSLAAVAGPAMHEIVARLNFLSHVGLAYLTLDRPADTLSGGELQRIRLATGVGTALVGVCYILDEPSIGLHARDNQRLIEALRKLQDQGNSVLVVEHDETIMRCADHLIDVGPGAGRAGGHIVAQGTPADIERHATSITGAYLSGRLAIEVPRARRAVNRARAIVLEGATAHNLRDIDAWLPLAALVCVTGVSGSGKSTLVNETLAKAIARTLTGEGESPGPHRGLKGVDQIDKLVRVDQSPIGRTPRSNPATYTGVFDLVRRVFATTREARLRGYRASRFSYNARGGRCEECQGHGLRRIDMHFLPDLYVTCPACRGARFNRATLEVRYRGRSIADVLDLSVDDALAMFENFPAIRRLLASLADVGLGYVKLGQPASTLSGGEAQRVKLAAELGRADTGRTLYILDEPTTGLHFDDVRRLLAILTRLVELGNSVIVIEHHLDVIKTADWVIDLGPEGGERGGRIIAEGTPEMLAALPESATGWHLKQVLNRFSTL